MVFNDKKILIIGDLILDTYLIGDVNRISPEAPVPIVDITKKNNKLGGAANVALNIKKLGSTPIVCSVIGDDINGNVLKKIFDENDIETKFIIKSVNRKTSNKTRLIGNRHQLIRYDDENICKLDVKDFNRLNNTINDIFENQDIDVIIIQDYDKGVINKLTIDNLIRISKIKNIPIIVDPKKKNFNYYKNIKLIKPNLKELKENINLDLYLDRDKLLIKGSKILHERGIEIVVVTLSEDGMYISYDNGNKNKIISGIKRNISDVSGAGDTVISVISILILDLPIEEIGIISNLAGGIVCEYLGVVPINKKRLIKEIKKKI